MDKGNYMFDISDYGQDVHTVASLLKKFLKELPDALIPDHMYQDLVACARLTDEETRLNTLKDLVYHLPTAHYHTLKFLMRHLGKVVAHSQQNKVGAREWWRTVSKTRWVQGSLGGVVAHSQQNKEGARVTWGSGGAQSAEQGGCKGHLVAHSQ